MLKVSFVVHSTIHLQKMPLVELSVFCIRYFSKTKCKPAKKITGQCFSTEVKAACTHSANLERETEITKIVTYPLFPLAFSYVNVCFDLSSKFYLTVPETASSDTGITFSATAAASDSSNSLLFLKPPPGSEIPRSASVTGARPRPQVDRDLQTESHQEFCYP